MLHRSPAAASGRTRRVMLLVLVYLTCVGRVAASSANNGGIHQDRYVENLTTDHKNSNNSKYTKKTESTHYKNDAVNRQSRALPRFGNPEVLAESSEENDFLESVRKSPSEINSLYVIPHLRPGRASTQTLDSVEIDQLENSHGQENKRNSYTVIPMLRYGRSYSLIPVPRFGKSVHVGDELLSPSNVLDLQDGKKEEISKYDFTQQVKKDNIIPMPRYGRSESIIPMLRFGRSDSMIPTMRFGRSESMIPTLRFGRADSMIPTLRFGRSDFIIPAMRFGRSESMIPTIRLGRSTLIPSARFGRSTSLIPMARYGRTDSLIPMVRYGRSDSLIPMARYGRSEFLIPMTRYGRSYSLIPMARYGRSDSIIPMARYGRSGSLIPLPRFGKSIQTTDESENPVFDSDEVRNTKFSEAELNLELKKASKRQIDDKEAIISYTSPEREAEMEAEKKDDELGSSDAEVRRQTNESLIPQIRYGRSYGKTKTYENEQPHIFILPNIRPGRSPKKVVTNKEKENSKSTQYGLLPYPRPGRSGINKIDKKKQYEELNEITDSTFEIKRSEEETDEQIVFDSVLEQENLLNTGHAKLAKEKSLINSDQDSHFVIPYPRPGKRDLDEEDTFATAFNRNNVDPYSHLFEVPKIDNEDVGNTSPNLKFEKLDEEGDSKRKMENKMSESEGFDDYLAVPHSRFQKRSAVVDKSKFLLPYQRPKRSNTILPFPRPGRSNSVLPYPRPGRSQSLLPYPRLGRSTAILPYPRPGRSTNILPYTRPGRSDLILPYPRPGRSTNIVPYPRPGRSDSILPYPRPGRSTNIVPYPRPGRSNSIAPFLRPDRLDLILPYPRPRKSISILSNSKLGRSTTIVPIPRPGRSARNEISKRNAREYFLPYSQAENNAVNERNSKFSGTSFQEDDPGTTSSKLKDVLSLVKKLNKEISTSNSIYLLPYPRPGRDVKRNFV